MPVSNKHSNVQRVFYSGFDGGLNLSVPSESLPKNELKEAVNVEFSPLTGSMKVRGGLVWSGKFDREISDVVPVRGRRGFLIKPRYSDTPYYFRWNNIWPVQSNFKNYKNVNSGVGRNRYNFWIRKKSRLLADSKRRTVVQVFRCTNTESLSYCRFADKLYCVCP